MAGVQLEEATKEQRLKAALWYAVGQAVDEVSLVQGIVASPHFIAGLSELLWAQIENAAHDMETFARHASRSTINTSDVLLLARRNEGLVNVLKEYIEKMKQNES
ncbi:apoptosis-inducing TAF9-like domain 1 family protein [Polychaeton citri CBS 116435]|uniref:Apoptosis-inducing TAF9-like domain 1 family protein n=1 Tax=Polychaeton citri CBS 116435 TaxID=1314669 RepID=A0A9P4UMA2_9PEZI|nr:apoptosis-inducing TAF9-like domain 1 family protein [Polychaeton citri CBS 116435]